MNEKKYYVLIIIFILLTTIIQGKEKYLEVAFYEAGFLFNEGIGIDKDFMLKLEDKLDLKFEYRVKPRARIWHELRTGLLPISVSGIKTEERSQFAWFVPYISQRNKAIILKENLENYQKMEDFINDHNSKIAIVRAFRHGAFYDEVLNKIDKDRIVEVATVERLFFLLKNKRVDLIISLPVFYRYEFARQDMEEITEIIDWDSSENTIIHGLVLSKKYFDREDYEKILKIVSQFKKDGTLKDIFSKYLSDDEVEEAMRF